MGSWDVLGGTLALHEVTKSFASGTAWKGRPEKVTALYAKVNDLRECSRVPRDT